MDRLQALAIFAAAARQHGLSATATTRAIAALEERLGAALFQRTTRSVRLTEQGALLLPRARQLLADLKDAEQLILGTTVEPQGTLVATAPVVFGRRHVLPVVAELLALHPRLTVRLLLLDRMVNLVDEGVDIALRIGELADSSLHAVALGAVRYRLVASPAYLAVHGTPEAPADLKTHAAIFQRGVNPSDDWRFGAAGDAAVRMRARLIVNDIDAGIAAAESGVGIGRFLSYQVSEAIAAGRLVALLDAAAPAPMPVHLLYPSARSVSPALRSFVDAMKVRVRQAAL